MLFCSRHIIHKQWCFTGRIFRIYRCSNTASFQYWSGRTMINLRISRRSGKLIAVSHVYQTTDLTEYNERVPANMARSWWAQSQPQTEALQCMPWGRSVEQALRIAATPVRQCAWCMCHADHCPSECIRQAQNTSLAALERGNEKRAGEPGEPSVIWTSHKEAVRRISIGWLARTWKREDRNAIDMYMKVRDRLIIISKSSPYLKIPSISQCQPGPLI